VQIARKGKLIVEQIATTVARAHARTIEAIPDDQRDLFMLQLIKLVEANDDFSKAPLRLR